MVRQKTKNSEKYNWRDGVEYSSVGIELAVSVFIGAFIGYRIDLYLKTKPWLMVFGMFLGACAGFYSLYKITVLAERKDREK